MEPLAGGFRRRWWPSRLVTAIAAATILVLAAGRVHIPYVVIAPGPTRDAVKLTEIGARTYAPQGSFHITTALVKDDEGIPLGVAVDAMLDPDEDLIRREYIYPPDSTKQETDQRNAADMSESQLDASVAAFQLLGIGVEHDGAFVQEVTRDAKAHGKLQPGDVIVAIDDRPVGLRDDLGPLVGRHPIGTVVKVTVRRDDQIRHFSFATTESPDVPGKPILGVTVVQSYRLPFDVEIDAGNIGGPSAGLIFALAVYDLLEPEDLTRGRKIAGSGVIRPDGTVEAVGAITQKVRGAASIGADLFLVPKGELEAAKRAARGSRLRVIGVETLREAIDGLRAGR